MSRSATKTRKKSNINELATLIPKIEIMVESVNVRDILCIVSYDQYCGLYNNPKTRHLSINIIRLNNFRSGSDFVKAYSKALSEIEDGTLLVIDDVRDFIQQGKMYDPGRLQQSLHLIDYYGTDIFKLYGGSDKAILELESILQN